MSKAMLSLSLKAAMAEFRFPGPELAAVVTVMVAAWATPIAAIAASAARQLIYSSYSYVFGFFY